MGQKERMVIDRVEGVMLTFGSLVGFSTRTCVRACTVDRIQIDE